MNDYLHITEIRNMLQEAAWDTRKRTSLERLELARAEFKKIELDSIKTTAADLIARMEKQARNAYQ